MKTLVYIDHFKGEIQPASWEAIGLAKSLGTASAVVFGSGVDAVVKAAFEYGADEVLAADDAALADFRVEPYASTLSALASAQSLGFSDQHPNTVCIFRSQHWPPSATTQPGAPRRHSIVKG